MTIRARLLVLAVLPLLVLVGMIAPSVAEDANRRADADRLVGLVQVSARATTLVHALQAERGATNTFVTSRGAQLADKGLFPDEGVAHVARRAGASVAG